MDIGTFYVKRHFAVWTTKKKKFCIYTIAIFGLSVSVSLYLSLNDHTTHTQQVLLNLNSYHIYLP